MTHRKMNSYRVTEKVKNCNPFDLPLLEILHRVGEKVLIAYSSVSTLCFLILIAVYHRKLVMQSDICNFCPVKSKQNVDRIIRALTEVGILITVKAEGSTGTKSKNLIFKGTC